MRRRPPDISFTRFTYSCAISLKMSAEPHEPCILMTIGDCDLAIMGKPSVLAPAVAAPAPLRIVPRVPCAGCFSVLILFPPPAWLIDQRARCAGAPLPRVGMKLADSNPLPGRPARRLHDVK